MAIFQKGADPAALEASATRLTGYAGELDAVRSNAAGAVHPLLGHWGGGDLDHLLGRWPVAEHQLSLCSGTLTGMAAALRRNAAAQTSTSAGGAGTPAVPTTPGTDPGGPGGPDLGDTTDGRTIPNVPGERRSWLDRLLHPRPKDDSPWTPQGLAYTDDGRMITTQYDQDDPSRGQITIQNADCTVTNVPISGLDHYGGVAVDGDNVYVTGNGIYVGGLRVAGGSYVRQYSLSDLQNGGTTPQSSTPLATGSTAAFHDGHLYVATFASDGPGRVYSYPVGADGSVSGTSDQDWPAPSKVQGLAVDDDDFYFSQPEGRDNDSALTRVDRNLLSTMPFLATWTGDSTTLPNMSEGIVEHDGKIYTIYESGSNDYNHGGDHLEPRDRITVTDLRP